MNVLPSFSPYAQSMVAIHIVVIISVLFQHLTCSAEQSPPCPPSSCGEIRNISYPFRLKGDPPGCGLARYELDCVNKATVLTLFSGKYYVQDINYKNYTIRLVDAGVVEDTACSIPRYFLNYGNFSYDSDPIPDFDYVSRHVSIGFLGCSDPVTDDPRYIEVNGNAGCDSRGHIYAFLTDNQGLTQTVAGLSIIDIKVGCRLEVATWTSHTNWTTDANNVVSYVDIVRSLEEGFLLSWIQVICWNKCRIHFGCYIDESTRQVECESIKHCHIFDYDSGNCGISFIIGQYIRRIPSQIPGYLRGRLRGIIIGFVNTIRFRKHVTRWPNDEGILFGQNILPIIVAIRILLGVTILLVLFIYKWRRRHYSIYENIEVFLGDNNLNPIRYEYKEIKKMTRGFKVKLGQGGFGTVYKGNLRSGPDVAIKMLSKSDANGQDFISEVATIGRIHHVNVVRLIGYCVEREKRALVYEYMPNGSLDKYIFSKEGSVSLSYEKTYEISLGIARGIAYLHHGCDVQILHFDIKPHNILLDDSFNPKVSDFGLAKLYPVKDRSIVLTEVRGTLGYMAPELFYKNIGGISYKADVYSFGMLLMEMTSRRRNSNPHAEHSSQHYFPFWIYDQFKEEKDIDMEDALEEDKILVKKIFLIALWCIQLKPNERPSMKKVVEMLEGKVESLKMPPKPIFYPHEIIGNDSRITFDQTTWSDSTSSNNSIVKTKSSHSLEDNA